METIVGLGEAGCNIAEQFAKYPQYKVLRIDSSHRKGKGFKLLPERQSHEEYEAHCPSLKAFFRNIQGETLFVVGGSGKISGACLRILEQIKGPVSVLYVQPDKDLLSRQAALRERVTFFVLQEYARSGLLQRFYAVSNVYLEEAIGGLSLLNFYEQLNELLVSTIHMTNVFKNTQPLIHTFSSAHDAARLSTFGIANADDSTEKMFFPFEMPREKMYYYAINKEFLESEKGLHRKIVSQLKDRQEEEGLMEVSYGIYPTDYPDNYVYTIHNSSLIQGLHLMP
tara:strand:- start:209 stop:1057 length:849 start_codon:yes stop_codon:yes gene_type:complete